MLVTPVVAAVICKGYGGASLIVKRTDATHEDCDCPDHDENHGKREFPGGKLEPGETPVEAVLREVREELGEDAVVDVDDLLYARVNVYGSGTPYLVLYYLCLPRKNFRVKDGVEAAWVDEDDVDGYDLLPGTMEVLQLL